ncbi:ATP-binding protein [Aidingimonas lacisalsi]|uniref:ATP-binding protein n=1 Tax=Aidingimonas lacisalsi TaxID=2604086 RepID=UPI0011D2388F|nr:ATP-binding protein [Aidingimonas lacisalsi]
MTGRPAGFSVGADDYVTKPFETAEVLFRLRALVAATAMNAVLTHDRRLIERSRHTAGNLAHALKTPLSVIRLNLPQLPEPQRQSLQTELTRIDDAVRHHLARASAAGDGAWFGAIDVNDILTPLLEGLSPLAERRELSLDCRLPTELSLHMDSQDLQEIIGNLLDNALRWARHAIELTDRRDDDRIVFTISDDGPGMNQAQRDTAITRGTRLDERRSGSGLGLAIVADLVALYGGELRLDRAKLGGLQVRIRLPMLASPTALHQR